MQFLAAAELESLIAALHKTVQRALPITLAGAGLPLIPRLAGEAKSYAERLFTFPVIGPLPDAEAMEALVEPAAKAGASYEPAAAAEIVVYAEGYPYFIQEYGKAAGMRPSTPASIATRRRGPRPRGGEARRRLLPRSCGACGPTRTAVLAGRWRASGRDHTRRARSRPRSIRRRRGSRLHASRLIEKGLLYTPGYGLAAFTVPQFDRYLLRSYGVRRPPIRADGGRRADPAPTVEAGGSPPPYRPPRSLLADAALLSVAIVWGLNFVVIKDAIADTGPMTYLLWRHIVAAILLAAVMPRTARQTTRRDWLYGAVLGFFLFVAFVTQTIGLQWTTPGKSGFITSLYIVMVPFLYWIVTRRSPGWTQIGGAVIATVGLGLLSFQGGLGMSKGDLLTLLGALGFAAQIAATGFFAPKTKPAVLALTQIVAAAVLFIVVTPFTEHITWDFGWQAWAAIVWTALSGTVFGFLIQAWAQKSTTSTRAAVILGLEGLFAAAFGLLFGMDVLSWRFVVGAALILAGVIVIETLPGRRGVPNPADVLPRAD